jgi:hypothetical protein
VNLTAENFQEVVEHMAEYSRVEHTAVGVMDVYDVLHWMLFRLKIGEVQTFSIMDEEVGNVVGVNWECKRPSDDVIVRAALDVYTDGGISLHIHPADSGRLDETGQLIAVEEE